MSSPSTSAVRMTDPKANLAAVIRILHWLALLVLALALALMVDLLLATAIPMSREMFVHLIEGGRPAMDVGLPVAVVTLTATIAILGFAVRRLTMRSARGWVYFLVLGVALVVANLELVATYPSVFTGFGTLLGALFWKSYVFSLLVLAGSLLVIGIVIRRLRPRSLRGFMIVGLTTAAVIVADLVLLAFCPPLLDEFISLPFGPFLNARDGEPRADLLLALTLSGVVPIVLLTTFAYLRRLSWWWIGGGYLVAAPLLVYLAADDAVIRRPITMEEISPAFPGAEKSFEVLMRYGNKHPLSRNFHAPDRLWKKPFAAGEAMEPDKPTEWRAFLTGHRGDIEADWADLSPERAWWTELNTFDRIGDLTPPSMDAEVVAFSPFRVMTQHGCAIASLQALDGHGDDAIDTLLPILQVGRKLQSSSRTLVRTMVAIIIERMSVQTAAFIVDHATLSPTARARLVAALAAPGGGPAGARRLIATEYAFGLNYSLGKPLGDLGAPESSPWLRHGLNAISPFVYNPRSSFNVYGDFVAEEQELVANRQFDRLNSLGQTFFGHEGRPRFKNFAGTLLIGAAIPAMSKVAESYWKTQDARAELLARLNKP